MKNLFCLSIVFLLLICCTKKKDAPSISNPIIIMDTTNINTYLALGDSYTIGEAIEANGRYPVQTENLLKYDTLQFKDPDIIAVTGWTTSNLINALNANPPKNNYTIVTLLIGVNNQYQHKSIDDYKTEFTELLNRAIAYAGNKKNHVFVLSIPDYSVTPFAKNLDTAEIAKEIDEFNAVNKSISFGEGVHYLDITGISREAKNNSSLIANDGLHPSAYQYELWSQLLAPMIKETL